MRVTVVAGATALQDLVYSRAPTGRIDSVNGSARPQDTWTYGYDTLDRLLSATNAGNAALTQTLTYDTAHNMLSNSAVGAYAYPAQGLGAIRPHAVTQAGPYALAYDATGNLTSKVGAGVSNLLTWDGSFAGDALRRANSPSDRAPR